MIFFVWTFVMAISFVVGGDAFQARPRDLAVFDVDPSTSSTAPSSSRRQLVSSIAGSVAGIYTMTGAIHAPPAFAEETSFSEPHYQGVFRDPMHPKGFRTLVGNDKKAKLQLQDDPKGPIFELPVKISKDKSSKEIRLKIDFSAKGGPSDMVGVLRRTTTEGGDTDTISFPDGNTWTEQTTGIAGVYENSSPSSTSPSYISIRPWKGAELKVDLYDANLETLASFGAKAGSQKAFFEYPGEFNKAGRINPNDHTLSFLDGMVWTRY